MSSNILRGKDISNLLGVSLCQAFKIRKDIMLHCGVKVVLVLHFNEYFNIK